MINSSYKVERDGTMEEIIVKVLKVVQHQLRKDPALIVEVVSPSRILIHATLGEYAEVKRLGVTARYPDTLLTGDDFPPLPIDLYLLPEAYQEDVIDPSQLRALGRATLIPL